MKAFQLLLPPLKFALRLLQFGMCIVNDICDTLLLLLLYVQVSVAMVVEKPSRQFERLS